MLLLIDVGNSDIVIARSDYEKIKSVHRIKTREKRTPDEYNVIIRSLIDCHEVKGVVISSVVPYVTNYLKLTFNTFFNLEPIFVQPGVKTGIKIKMSNPLELGADLLSDTVGFAQNYGGKGIIVDLGTASKYLYVEENTLSGAIISSGVRTALDSLIGSTALLPEVDLSVPKTILGNNTTQCMQSGATYGKAAEVDGIIRRIKNEINDEDIKIVATGGLSPLIVPLCEEKIILDTNLLLKGLLYIYLKNNK